MRPAPIQAELFGPRRATVPLARCHICGANDLQPAEVAIPRIAYCPACKLTIRFPRIRTKAPTLRILRRLVARYHLQTIRALLANFDLDLPTEAILDGHGD